MASFKPGRHDSPVHLATPGSFICFLALGVLDYRVLGTNFKDYAVIFTQLEFGDEAFNTVELYSKYGQARLLRITGAPNPGTLCPQLLVGNTQGQALANLRLARYWDKKGAGPLPHSAYSGHLLEAVPSCLGRTEMASREAMQLFTKWSQGLGFLSQQQAQLQKDRECH